MGSRENDGPRVDAPPPNYDEISATQEQRIAERVAKTIFRNGSAKKILVGGAAVVLATATLAVAGQALLVWNNDSSQDQTLEEHAAKIDGHDHEQLESKIGETYTDVQVLKTKVEEQAKQIESVKSTSEDNQRMLRDLHRRFGGQSTVEPRE